MVLRDVVLRQKQELEKTRSRTYVSRDISFTNREKPIIKVISGPRRAGKSFFALHELESFGYCNFDDEALIDLENYDDLIATIDRVYQNPDVLFLDEIQNLNSWELFVNRLQRAGRNLVISGSNARMLSRELATHLTGRHSKIIVFPFSFSEYLDYVGNKLTTAEKKSHFQMYLQRGGYPEPLIHDIDEKQYMGTLFESTLFKDIVTRHKIRYPEALEQLAYHFISNFCNPIAYKKVANFTDIGSDQTVQKYLSYLEETYLLFQVQRFSFKTKQQVRANKKIYVIDNGLISAVGFRFSADIGRFYENLVAIQLKKQQLAGKLEFFYYKDNYEVDFVVKKGTTVTHLIQVCSNLEQPSTRHREVRGLLHARKKLGCDNLLLLTGDYEGIEQVEWHNKSGTIRCVPLWKWLLGKGIK
ncbi:MAG: ATP-binding protein [bacterium]